MSGEADKAKGRIEQAVGDLTDDKDLSARARSTRRPARSRKGRRRQGQADRRRPLTERETGGVPLVTPPFRVRDVCRLAVGSAPQRSASSSAITTATREKNPTRAKPTIVTACGWRSSEPGFAYAGPIGLAVWSVAAVTSSQPAATRAADRQAEAAAAHEQEADDAAQREQTELHAAPDEEQRRQVDAEGVRAVVAGPVGRALGDQRPAGGDEERHRAERGDPRVEPGAAVPPGAANEPRSTSTPRAPAATRAQYPTSRVMSAAGPAASPWRSATRRARSAGRPSRRARRRRRRRGRRPSGSPKHQASAPTSMAPRRAARRRCCSCRSR